MLLGTFHLGTHRTAVGLKGSTNTETGAIPGMSGYKSAQELFIGAPLVTPAFTCLHATAS